jgi:SAM-dependent methyltransferase
MRGSSAGLFRKACLGCGLGTGEYACWFAAKGADVTALDLSIEALEQARQYAEKHNLDSISFHEGSVLDLPFDAKSFDLVYCTGVLHHTPAPYQGFQELCRVARPGGKILISLYHAWGFLPRSFRWNLVRLLAGKDLDQRVEWGRFLFPFVTHKLLDEDLEDPESLLYDHFAAPQQSTHRVGEVLQWFNKSGLMFQGTFPPARPADYPALFQHEGYQSIEQEIKSPLHDLVSRIGDSGMSRQPPNLIERFVIEVLWILAGIDIFSACGTKVAERQKG